jgi:serine/threonine protein kinase
MDDVLQPGANAPARDAPPTLPEGLEMIRPLGDGKMAKVYLARETELQRAVAVKVLRSELCADDTARARFEREARSAASLTHPSVVAVHRFGRLPDGTPYLVMTYVNGRTLADRLKAEGPMREQEARTLLKQMASALAAAHKKGIVHRDVRPANVLVEEDTGRFLLADFGIAGLQEGGGGAGPRLTRTGQIIGEPRYSSPEQLRGEKVTGQADLYSLAILAYEVLTGEGPYRVHSTRETIAAHLAADPRPISKIRPGISADLEDLLLRCLARQPTHRPRADDVVKRLEAMEALAATPAESALHGAPRLVSTAGDGLDIMGRRIPQIVASTAAAGGGLLALILGVIQIGAASQIAFWVALNLVAWGIAASFVLAWFHGERGRQPMPPREKWILGGLGAGWAISTAILLMQWTG